MEEKILSILSNMQEDIGKIKDNQEIIKEDVSGLKEDVSHLKEDMSEVKTRVSNLEVKTQKIENEQKEMNNVQKQILEELRINKLNVAQIMETLNRSINENKKEHQTFDNRIKRLEKRAI